MVFYSWSVMKLHTHESKNVPCVAVKTHNDALDASPIFRASAFCEQFINLFLSGVETQVTDLINILSKFRDIACKNAHRESRTWKAGRPASVYRREIGSPCNLKAGRGAARRAPLEKGLRSSHALNPVLEGYASPRQLLDTMEEIGIKVFDT